MKLFFELIFLFIMCNMFLNKEQYQLEQTIINQEYMEISNIIDNKPIEDLEESDILKLQTNIKNVIGWINITNTNIDYPIVKYSDNEYYLNHTPYQIKNFNGSIFLDYRNNSDFSNLNTIIYGHGRSNGTMFGDIRNIIDYNWYLNNPIISIVTNTNRLTFKMFSIYTIEPETYYLKTNFVSDDDYQQFLNTIKSRSIYDFSIIPNNQQKIITLSTCYNQTKRVVIHAILLENVLLIK